MKLFFSDYTADRHVSADEALDVAFTKVLEEFESLTDEDGCFLGIMDDKEQVLQFIYNNDGTLSIDIPVPEKEGSFHRGSASFEECREILIASKHGVRIEAISGLAFQHW